LAAISNKGLILQQDSVYFQKFIAKNGDEYGLRFGNPNDAEAISKIFTEVYDYKYAYPFVYDINHLRSELVKKDNFWFVGELLETKEIAGAGLLEKKRYIAHASQGVVKKKFQGKGVTTKIGAAGIISCTQMPQFKDILRLDSEVRGMKIGAQKLLRNAGALPYCLIPSYINFGDKRDFKDDENQPVPPIQEEAAFFYSIIFNSLWNKRENKIYMLDNEDFIFFHEFLKNRTKKMKEDEVILENGKKNKGYELYGVFRDFYEGRVNLYNYIQEKSLDKLLKIYKNWRIILWRIPTTQNGIHSMSLALQKGFNIVGYDLGFNNINWTLNDSVILAYYPNGGSQNLRINCLDENKPLFNKIREIFFSRLN
jgi:hypothetical protein